MLHSRDTLLRGNLPIQMHYKFEFRSIMSEPRLYPIQSACCGNLYSSSYYLVVDGSISSCDWVEQHDVLYIYMINLTIVGKMRSKFSVVSGLGAMHYSSKKCSFKCFSSGHFGYMQHKSLYNIKLALFSNQRHFEYM